MSVKACQLCGKPLGRRGDGDFCSSEHRNQFRLRKGMDRLEEANIMSSLMRRRENLRQIPTMQMLASSANEGRAALIPMSYPVRAVEAGFASFALKLFHTEVLAEAGRFSDPLSNLAGWSSAAFDRTVSPASLPFVMRSSAKPVMRSIPAKNASTTISAAQFASVRSGVSAGQENSRQCGAALRVSRRAALPTKRFSIELPTSTSLEKTRRLHSLPKVVREGSAADTRIRPGFEFEKRALSLPSRTAELAAQSQLPHSRPRPTPAPPIMDSSCRERACAIAQREITPRTPSSRTQRQVTGVAQSEATRLCPAAYEMGHAADHRLRDISWRTDAPVALRSMRAAAFAGGSFSNWSLVRVDTARDAARDHRPAEVRFAPSDSGFDYAPIELHGTIGPGGGDPSRGPEPIEEHFNDGLSQWAGDLTEWKLDAAGARPIGLALFRPTLELADYEFEFFTRIEARGVTFVFRAANTSNYHKVTIATVESGRYELRRCTVIGGVEEKAVASPLPGVIRPGAAFTVKTTAWQNDFTIWLEGEVAARWKDGRLPIGGIGFMAPRDDRARVYWVRLSQSDSPNSTAGSHRPLRSIQ